VREGGVTRAQQLLGTSNSAYLIVSLVLGRSDTCATFSNASPSQVHAHTAEGLGAMPCSLLTLWESLSVVCHSTLTDAHALLEMGRC